MALTPEQIAEIKAGRVRQGLPETIEAPDAYVVLRRSLESMRARLTEGTVET